MLVFKSLSDYCQYRSNIRLAQAADAESQGDLQSMDGLLQYAIFWEKIAKEVKKGNHQQEKSMLNWMFPWSNEEQGIFIVGHGRMG